MKKMQRINCKGYHKVRTIEDPTDAKAWPSPGTTNLRRSEEEQYAQFVSAKSAPGVLVTIIVPPFPMVDAPRMEIESCEVQLVR
jgi:hypothetical protein